MTTPGVARRIVQVALRDQRGTAFLMGLMIVMVMTLLGVALFEMSTIEAILARSDALDIQAFYCAEAEAARVYACYGRAKDRPRSSPARAPSTLRSRSPMARTSRASRRWSTTGVVTVTATCKLPTPGAPGRCSATGNERTPTPSSGSPRSRRARTPVGGHRSVFGDMVLGGTDSIIGDIYVSGNVHLRGEGTVTGYDTPDPPAITVAPGKAVTSTSPPFDAGAAGPWATGTGHSPAGAEQRQGERHHRQDPVGRDERRRNPDDDGDLPERDRLQPRGDLCPARRHQRGQ